MAQFELPTDRDSASSERVLPPLMLFGIVAERIGAHRSPQWRVHLCKG